jgi:hypothetical protein
MYARLTVGLLSLFAATAMAGPVYQPPGSNLTYGDVTHGQRVQSASGNPAAAAADLARGADNRTRGTVLSVAAGLEYGNVQELWDFYDSVTEAYKASESGTGGGPGQVPEGKPAGGIDLGDIWDSLDPDFQATIAAVAQEVARQAVLLALIKNDGYGKAWVAADAPFVLGSEHYGGAWTFGLKWSGASKAFSVVQEIDFDEDDAQAALEDWFNQLPINQPVQFPVSDDILLTIEPFTDAVLFAIQNDSSMLSKASQTTALEAGYSRRAWSNDSGSLYLGAEARLYLMRLSRLSVRFGDITDSEELFDAIRDSQFENDARIGVDIGALWVGENYQLGAQLTNINQPKFTFPDVNLNPYSDATIIGLIQGDKIYEMDRQLKLEASLFSSDRRWSAHVGLDADSATDPLGDEYQWATLSVGLARDSWWLPGARIGYRKNLAGTEKSYVSLGLTAFRIFNIDISSALDTVGIDGKTLPQGLMINIGFQITW